MNLRVCSKMSDNFENIESAELDDVDNLKQFTIPKLKKSSSGIAPLFQLFFKYKAFLNLCFKNSLKMH